MVWERPSVHLVQVHSKYSSEETKKTVKSKVNPVYLSVQQAENSVFSLQGIPTVVQFLVLVAFLAVVAVPAFDVEFEEAASADV